MAVSPQQAALETTCQRIARIMAQRYGVTVRIEGARAYVDLQRDAIVLPSMPLDGMDLSDEILDGFLDHECAHVIHTDRSIFDTIKGDASLHDMWNNVEDVWIERVHGKHYVGCRANMERLNAVLFQRVEERWEELAAFPRLYYALERCYRGDHDVARYAHDALIGAVVNQLAPEVERGRVCADSREALSIARAVLEKVQDLAEGGAREVDDESTACDSDGGAGGGVAEAGEDKKQKRGGAGGSEESGETACEESHEADSRSEEHGESGADPAIAGATEEQRLKAQAQATELLESLKSGKCQRPLDAEGLVNEMLTEFHDWSTRHDPDVYLVFTEAYDTEVTYDAPSRVALTTAYDTLRQKAKEHVGNLANILEMTLAAEAESRWVGGARRGRHFDRRRLAHWAEGSDDDRIFRYLEQGHRHDTAVTMLWDCSGSMGSSQSMRNKAALARIAAVACHEALKRCRIAHEVLGFNTGGGYSDEVSWLAKEAENSGDDLSRYSRIADLDARMVFVPFGSDDGRPLVEITGGAANRDGECVLWAARRLAQRPEKRKILIVGSDGHPQGARYHRTEKEHLRAVVGRVITAGIEVYALGIMDRAVQYYYPRWQVIHNMTELPRAVLTQLAQSLPAQAVGGRTDARCSFL
jgi:cobalamin biosynthesis protein CobT